MIELGTHLLEMGDWVQSTLRNKYFEALTLVLNRGELSLSSLTMRDIDPSNKKIYTKKVDIASEY